MLGVDGARTDWTPAKVAAVVGLLLAVANAIHAAPRGDFTYDFGAFWASGYAWRHGLDVYALYDQPIAHQHTWPNLNPPLWLPVFALFSRVDPTIGFRALWVANLIFIPLVAEIVARREGWSRWAGAFWATSTSPLWSTIGMGQVYAMLPVLAALALASGTGGAVALALLIALKPQFVLVLPLLVVAGHWRLGLRAGVALAAVQLAAVALLGVDVHLAWFELVRTSVPDTQLAGNASIYSLGAVPAGLAALAIAWRAWHATDEADAVTVGLAASILLSPVGWIAYTLVLVPSLARRRWAPLAGLLLAVPVALYFMSPAPLLRLPAIVAVGVVLWSPWAPAARQPEPELSAAGA